MGVERIDIDPILIKFVFTIEKLAKVDVMAVAETLAPRNEATDTQPSKGGWLATVLFAEALFFYCRAASHHSVNLDEIGYWLLGLAPFVAQLLGRRLFGWTSVLLQIWFSSLLVFLLVQFSGMAHFIEYPLNLAIDAGLVRNLANSSVYVVSSAFCVFCVRSTLGGLTRPLLREIALSTVFAWAAFAVLVFQPY